MMPSVLKRYNVFVDGDNWLGLVEELELPKITAKVESYRGAGMMAPAPIHLGYEDLKGSMTLGGVVLAALQKAMVVGVDKTLLRFSGAYQRDDTCAVTAADIIMRGMFTEVDPGTAKEGEKNSIKVAYQLSYYKIVIGGDTVVEIDALTTREDDLAQIVL